MLLTPAMQADVADHTSQRLFGRQVPRAMWVHAYMKYFAAFCQDIDEPVTLADAHAHAVEMVFTARSETIEALLAGTLGR